MNKTLVAYFSATGTTRKKALEISEKNNGDLYEIIPKQKYTNEDLNWNNPESRTSIEIKNLDFRPDIEEINIDLNEYDTIYIGYPIWWGIAPNVIKTFLDKIDLKNKKIIPFCTSGGSNIEESLDDLKKTYRDINIIEN